VLAATHIGTPQSGPETRRGDYDWTMSNDLPRFREASQQSLGKGFQSPCKHNVYIRGQDSSVTVEPEFWEQLRIIALEQRVKLNVLITEIDRTGRLLPPQGLYRRRVRTLSAAIRVFVLYDVLAKLAQAQEPPATPGITGKRP
jgi:predicted DNA-binding ribbon-helix-helix protein